MLDYSSINSFEQYIFEFLLQNRYIHKYLNKHDSTYPIAFSPRHSIIVPKWLSTKKSNYYVNFLIRYGEPKYKWDGRAFVLSYFVEKCDRCSITRKELKILISKLIDFVLQIKDTNTNEYVSDLLDLMMFEFNGCRQKEKRHDVCIEQLYQMMFLGKLSVIDSIKTNAMNKGNGCKKLLIEYIDEIISNYWDDFDADIQAYLLNTVRCVNSDHQSLLL